MNGQLLAIVLISLSSLGCDTFFEVNGVVVSCDGGRPVVGARVLAHLDQGAGEKDLEVRTEANGRFKVWMNEPASAWVTLAVHAPGFASRSTQFKGVPSVPAVEICLQEASSRAQNR